MFPFPVPFPLPIEAGVSARQAGGSGESHGSAPQRRRREESGSSQEEGRDPQGNEHGNRACRKPI